MKNKGNCSESTSKMLRISSVWRIRQIDFHIKAFICASTTHALYENLLGSEQLRNIIEKRGCALPHG